MKERPALSNGRSTTTRLCNIFVGDVIGSFVSCTMLKKSEKMCNIVISTGNFYIFVSRLSDRYLYTQNDSILVHKVGMVLHHNQPLKNFGFSVPGSLTRSPEFRVLVKIYPHYNFREFEQNFINVNIAKKLKMINIF